MSLLYVFIAVQRKPYVNHKHNMHCLYTFVACRVASPLSYPRSSNEFVPIRPGFLYSFVDRALTIFYICSQIIYIWSSPPPGCYAEMTNYLVSFRTKLCPNPVCKDVYNQVCFFDCPRESVEINIWRDIRNDDLILMIQECPHAHNPRQLRRVPRAFCTAHGNLEFTYYPKVQGLDVWGYVRTNFLFT